MQRTGLFVILALSAASLPAYAAADQFDLACTGQMQLSAVGNANAKPVVETKPFTTHYRIDLGANHWCAAGCGKLNPVISSSPTNVVLSEPMTPQGGQELTVNRSDGKLTGKIAMTDATQSIHATGEVQAECTQQPFSGFPAGK